MLKMNTLVSILLTILVCSPNTTGIESWFPTNRNGEMFTNMVVNDRVYVAENGWINLLDTNLSPLWRFPTCAGDNCVNINKVLSVFEDVLILCGTGNDGICQVWNGTQFRYNSSTNVVENYLVVSSSVDRPAVGLVHEEDLFLGVTYGPGIDTTENTYKYLLSRRGIKESFNTLGFVDLKDNSYNNYLVYFKKVFEHEGFIYFLTNQKLKIGSVGYVSKLVRMCINETIENRNTRKLIKSYTDIVMSCNVDGVDYNLLQDAEFLPENHILVAAFAKGNDPEKPQSSNAICVYTIYTVNAAILNAKEDFITCNATGSIERESAYLDIDLPRCWSQDQYEVLKEDDYICPKEGRGTKVIGTVTLHPTTTYKIEDTSITVTTVKGVERYGLYPDVFLGTDKGSIIKRYSGVTCYRRGCLYNYWRYVIIIKIGVGENLSISSHGQEIIDTGHHIKDIHFGPDDVYIVSDRRVFKAKNTDCSIFTTCRETIEIKDPLCGWCIEENRSTRKTECTRTWLSSFSECVSIEASPKYISVYSRGNADIVVTTKNFPPSVTSDVRCRYIDVYMNAQIGSLLTASSISNEVFECKDPGVMRHVVLRLQIIFLGPSNLFSIAETTIQIYKCGSFPTCSSCMVSSEVNCSWCTTTLHCSETCDGQSISQGAVKRCPTLLVNHDMYLPSGLLKSLTIQAANLVQSTEYQCVVKLMTRTVKTNATANIDQNTLTCVLEVLFENNTAKEEFPISVLQVTGYIQTQLLNEYALYVTVYKCEYLATDCTMCNALISNRYECNWCPDGHCGHSSVCSNVVTCPPPRITGINPSIGGYKGGTIITISGTDLGTDPNGVQEVQCVPLFESADIYTCQCNGVQIMQTDDSDFHPVNKELRCRYTIHRFSSENIFVGLVNLTFRYEGLRAEPVSYRLVNPIVTHIEPVFGPISGGTVITLTGTDLTIADALTYVKLGSVICRNSTLNQNRIICTTSAVTRTFNVSSVTLLTGDESYRSDASYNYVNTPVIEAISSQKTILSGGTKITIYGQNLKNAKETRIKMFYAGSEKVRSCSSLSSEETICLVPDAPDILRREMEENLNAPDADLTIESGRISADASINFDGYVKTFTVQYFRNPSIATIGGYSSVVQVDPNNRELLINGQYMNLGADEADYTISIGQTGICDGIILTLNNLTCLLPATSPGPDNENMEVIVSIGNFNSSVGYVKYGKSTEDDSTDDTVLLIGISVSVVLALLIIIGTIVFCIRYRRVKARTPKMRRSKDKKTQLDDAIGTTERNTSFPTNRTNITGDGVTGQSTYMELDHRQNPGQEYESLDRNQDHGRRNEEHSTNTDIDSGTVYEGLDRNQDHDQHIYLGLNKKK